MRMWVANFTVTVPTVWREGKGSALGCCPFCWGKVAQPRSGPCIHQYKSGMILLWVILSLQGYRWDHCLTKVRFHRGKSADPLLVGTERSIEMWFLFLLCFLPQASSAVVRGSSAGGKLYRVLLHVTLKEHIYCPFSSKECNGLP